MDIIGTVDADRLRGTSGDDRIEGLGDDDTLIGGSGIDTAVYAGSVHDYIWSVSKYVNVTDMHGADGDTGRDELQDIEILEFDDATIVLGQDVPTVFEGPRDVYVTVGEEVETQFRVYDYDHRLNPGFSYEWGQGVMGYQVNRTEGLMSSDITATVTYDTSGYYFTDEMRALAEGETMDRVVTMTVDYISSDYMTGERPDPVTYDIVYHLVGVNDAPTISGSAKLLVREDAPPSTLSLAPFGDDIDSDDNGASLTYEIVGKSHWMFDAWIEGTTLYLGSDRFNRRMTSDELRKGWVDIRAVDSHGEASDETMRVQLRGRGVDDPNDVDYVGGKGVDLNGLGIDLADHPVLGSFSSFYIDESYVDVFDFSGRKDVTVIRASDVGGFTKGRSYTAEDGSFEIDDLWFNMKNGDDRLIIDARAAAATQVALVDIVTADGEDVVSVQARATSLADDAWAVLNGVDITTGRHSDEVWLHARAQTDAWITGNYSLGTGHDRMFVRITDPGDGPVGGYAFFDGTARLGSGDDVFDLKIETSTRGFQNQIEINLYAQNGNDFVRLQNSGSERWAASPGPDDPFVDQYHAGLMGYVDMGLGNDRLVLDLNDPYDTGEHATLDGGGGWDRLWLDHIGSVDEVEVVRNGNDLTVIHGNQTLDISDFERVFLDDGTDLMLL